MTVKNQTLSLTPIFIYTLLDLFIW